MEYRDVQLENSMRMKGNSYMQLSDTLGPNGAKRLADLFQEAPLLLTLKLRRESFSRS